LKRKLIIKDVLDLILLHTEYLRKQPKNRIEEYVKKYVKIAEEEKNGLRHKVRELEKEISLLKILLEKAKLRIERSKIHRKNRFERNEPESKNEID
jgi:hypothetical protein